jgi:hypothetical protein
MDGRTNEVGFGKDFTAGEEGFIVKANASLLFFSTIVFVLILVTKAFGDRERFGVEKRSKRTAELNSPEANIEVVANFGFLVPFYLSRT